MSSPPMSASPFEQYLGTNHVPSDAQLPEISAFVKQSDAQLAELDAELAALQEKRDKLKEFIDGHKALLSITRRLPTDIMQNIFNQTLPPFAFNTTMAPSDSPLLLTRICRSWREIAINHAPLWSAIHIPIPGYPTHDTHVPGYVVTTPGERILTEEQREVFDLEVKKWISRMEHRKALVKIWLSRAKGSDLSISIIVDRAQDPNTEEYFKGMVDVIRRYSTQWRSLFLTCPDGFSKYILSIPARETPILCTLNVDISAPTRQSFGLPGNEPEKLTTFPPDSLITGPSLRILSVEAIPVKIQSVPAPFANLTELHFWGRVLGVAPRMSPMYLTSASALGILELCPNLRKCSLSLGFEHSMRFHHLPGFGQPPQEERTQRKNGVVLPHLHTLFLEQEGDIPLQMLIDNIDLPALTNLGITRSVLPCAASAAPVVKFLQNWGHTLKRLYFDYREVTAEELKTCFELGSGIETMVLSFSRNLNRRHNGMWHAGRTRYDDPGSHEPAPAYFTNSVLEMLTPRVDVDKDRDGGLQTEVLCPNLRIFDVTLSTVEFDEKALLRFVCGRRHQRALETGIARLERVRVGFAVGMPKEYDDDARGGTSEQKRGPARREEEDRKLDWPPLRTLKQDDSEVDLEGLKVDVTWGHDVLRGHNLNGRPRRSIVDAVWDPDYGVSVTTARLDPAVYCV